jgi:flagellar protein FlgJ
VSGGAQQAAQGAAQQAGQSASDLLNQGWQVVGGAANQTGQSASDLLNQGWQVVSGQQTATDPSSGAAVNTPDQASQANAAARQSQFGLGLSSADAMAFCGPTAAMAFAQTYGRNPTVDEAKQLAQQVGWNPQQGMAGVSSEVNLLQKMGIDAHATQGVDWSQVQSSATSGNPVILDTPGHYYYVDGYNQQTQQYHVGTSGTDLKGGSDWMTSNQINQMSQSEGPVRSAVFADHPLGQGNPVTDVLGQASQAAGQAGQSAQDLLNQGWQVVSGAAQGAGQAAQGAAQAVGGAIDSSSPTAFAKSFAPYAQQAGQKLGIDPAWITAMAASESNYGNASGNELFGIKALPGQPGTSMMTHEGEYGGTQENQTFASYNTPQDSVNAFVNLLQNHYPGAVGAQTLQDFVHGLKQGGYFTAAEPEYLGILQSIDNKIGGTVDQALSGAQQAGQGAQQAVSSAGQTAQDLLNQGWQTVGGAADQTGQSALDLYNQAQQALDQAGQQAQQDVGQTAQDLGQTAGQTGQDLLDAYNQATQGAQDLVDQAQQSGQDLSSFIQQAPDAAAQVVQQAATGGQAPGDLSALLTGMLPSGTTPSDFLNQFASPAGQDLLNMLTQGATSGVGQDVTQNILAPLLGMPPSGAVGAATSQTAQDLLSQAGAELTSPNLNQDVYNASPTAWFNQQLASLGQDLTGGQTTTIPDLLGAPEAGRMALGQTIENQGWPVVSGLLGSLLQAPSALDSAQTLQDLQNKYGQGIQFDANGHLSISPVDTSAMSPADQQAYNQATMAIGGLEAPETPELGALFGEGSATQRILNEAGQVLATPGAPMEQMYGRATGGGLLQQALDNLSQYPEETAAPIRDFAAQMQTGDNPAQASQIASTIWQWMLQNPLSGEGAVPNEATATGAELRDAGQQAVADVSNILQDVIRGGGANRGGAGPYMPGGEMPGQLGLLPEELGQLAQGQLGPFGTTTQPTLPQGAGLLDQILQNLSPAQRAAWQERLPTGTGLLEQAGNMFSPEETQALDALASQAKWQQAQRGWAASDEALAKSGLVGDRTGTSMSVGAERGSPAQYLQDVIPGFNPRNPVSVGDWFNLIHTSAVTSALNTLTKVGMHTGITPMWDAGAHGAYDVATGNLGRAMGGVLGLQDALMQGGRNALLGIADAYKDPSAISQRVDNPIAQHIAQAIETPMNAHASLQGFNKEMTSSMEVSRLAGNAAWDQTGGLGGFLKNPGQFVSRYQELKANPLPGWQQAADQVGQRSALRGELGGWGSLINRVVKANDRGGQSTVGNLAWPVFRIGWNGAVQKAEKSPIGALGTAWDVGRGLGGFGPYGGANVRDLIPALRNDLSTSGEALAQGRGANSPFARPVQPGVTPLAERVKNNVMGTATDLATMAIATALTHRGLDGTVTGNGPDDPATRAQLTAGGWLQNAIHLPGVGYVDTATLMPTGGETMNLVGNLMDAINYPTQTEVRNVQAGRSAGVPDWVYGAESLGGSQHANAHAAIDQSAMRLLQHVGQNLASDAGLRQIGTLANWLYGRSTGTQALTTTAGGTLGGLVPYSGLLRSLAQAGDVAQRQPQNVGQAIMQNLPGLRGQVPSRIGPTGQAEPNPRAGLGTFSPVTTGAAINDPTLGILDQHGITVPAQTSVANAPTGAFQVNMTPDEQRMVEMRRGYLIQQNVSHVMSGPGYGNASRDQQSAMLKRAVSVAGSQAEGEMVSRIRSQDPTRLEPAKKIIVTSPQPGPRPQITTP